jgi:hypothetical protein
MLIPAEALRKAREGGWHECRGFQFTGALRGPGGHSVVLIRQGTDRPMIKKVWPEAVALDAKFWQGLGEALGWSMRDVGRGYSGWADTAHRFYDLMLTGQPTEGFWEKVLKTK